jgi:Lysine-specific metallo-endopeptidase
MGAMRIDEEALSDEQLGTVTILHEASHKFAGTIDYCYFDKPGKNPKSTFTDKQQALINTDSYGYFIVKSG